ncbi:MAG: hypothetical protein FJ279_11415 [Planctomycetes bacterium]|nr:hypothetical protein [Planctomycetota bacterium]
MSAVKFEPTWESLKQYRCPDWFRDAKFGIWAHWGPQCAPMCGDWYARNLYMQGSAQYEHHCRVYGHPSQFGYKDVIELWKGERFDPEALIALGWPRENWMIRSLAGTKVTRVAVLGCEAPVAWQQTPDGLRVPRPAAPPCDHAYAIRVQLGQ